MNGLLVHAAGPRSLIQDRGRFGHHRLGVTTGGPLDAPALDWANAVLDNSPDCAGVEIALGGFVAETMIATWIAVTGPGRLRINDDARASWTAQRVRPGDRIAVDVGTNGLCAYLGVAGGITSARAFGSRAMVLREGLGGIHDNQTQPLRAGDFLPAEPDGGPRDRPRDQPCQRSVPEILRPTVTQQVIVRLLPGFEWRQFSRRARRDLYAITFTVSADSSRMGLRLDGPAVTPPTGGMVSQGVCAGTVQVTPDGQPIVLLADRQTIGGYPRPGAVITADLPALGQLRPGASVRMMPTTADAAGRALRRDRALFRDCVRRWEADTSDAARQDDAGDDAGRRGD